MMRTALALTTMAMLAACGQSGDGGNGTAAAPSAGPLAAGVAMQPGQWESRLEIVNANMPQMPPGVTVPGMQPITRTICLTPEQAANPGADALAANGQQPAGCRTENFSFANGRIQGTSSCDHGAIRARSTISGQYTPTSYEMTVRTETESRGTTSTSEMRISARRIGDCPAP